SFQRSQIHNQDFSVKSLFGEIVSPKNSQVKLKDILGHSASSSRMAPVNHAYLWDTTSYIDLGDSDQECRHCGCLFCKIRNAVEFDEYISAEIPDPVKDPRGYKMVTELMMHGPCGVANLGASYSLGKFDRKVDEGFLVGVLCNQSNPSAGVQEQFDVEKAGEENVLQYVLFPVWSFGSNNPQNTDGDAAFEVKEPEFEGRKPESEVNVSSSSSASQRSMMTRPRERLKARVPLKLEDITYSDDEEDVGAEADFTNLETTITVSPIPTRSMTRVAKDQGGLSQIHNDDFPTCMFTCFLSQEEPKRKVWVLVDLPNGKRATGHTQEVGIDYEEVFTPVARIEAIRLFLAYASFMGFMVYQMDVKSDFLYETIEEEKQDGIFISQDKYVAEFLRKFGLTDRKSASTPIDNEKPLLKDPDGEDVDVRVDEVNVDDVPAAGFADEDAASVAVDDVPAAVDEHSIPSPTPPTQQPQPSQDIPSTSQDKIAQALEIINLKQRVKKLERRNKLKVSKLRRLKKVGTAQKVDTSEDTVMDDEVAVDAEIEENADNDEIKPAELKEVVEVVTTAKLMTEVVTAASATITAVATAAAPTLTTILSAARRRKRVVIRDPEETATPSTIIHTKPKSKDKGKGIMVHEPKPLKKKTQIEQDKAYARELERNLQTEAQSKKNMMIYLRNMAGFKMDYFKRMTYDDIRPIFEKKFNSNVAFLLRTKEQMEEEDSRALKRKVESSEDKAVKKQKLNEEVEELRKHLQIVLNNDDDVYTEATPLALKVPVVDYEIYTKNNKPYYKIKRADRT
nr:hypothetical protein [Tanacetum cinerariifolium]